MGKLTETEAETLAVMLTSATRKMACVKTGAPLGRPDYYAWVSPYEAIRDLCEGFYEIAPLAVYGVCI
jgi:hypothetical protein